MKQEENMATLSDTKSAGFPHRMGQSKHSGVWNIVKKLNEERIKVDQMLRNEEQAEIRSLLNKHVRQPLAAMYVIKVLWQTILGPNVSRLRHKVYRTYRYVI